MFVFAFWARIRKFKMASIFEKKKLLKNLLRCPVDRKFRRNCSLSLTVKEIEAIYRKCPIRRPRMMHFPFS